MPSARHELLAWALPRVKRSRELDSPERERARLERRNAGLESRLPTGLVRGFDQRFAVTTESLPGPEGDITSYTITPRGALPRATVYYLHGGGFVNPIDPFHVRYVARLATALGARVVLPDYPLAPAHSWCDSHAPLAAHVGRCAAESGRLVLAGDSAGGGLALALAQTVRDHGGAQPSHLLLHSPWVDLTTSTPETYDLDPYDPWLFIGKVEAYAAWWAGPLDDLARPEVSPGLANLDGLPPALMFCGTRDLLVPGCRLLADRAAASDWSLAYLEAPGLIHVFPVLPAIPEARVAWQHTLAFLR